MERKTTTTMRRKKKRLKRDDDLIMGRKKKMMKKRKLKRDPLIMRRKKKKLKRDIDMMVMKLDSDMHLEIVSRLPFKKAVQCRCVCKSWRTLLHDNFLINIHAKTQLKLHGYDHQHAHSSSSSSSSTIVSFISFPEEENLSLFGFYDDNLCSYKESSFNDSSSKFEDATMINSCNGLICLNTYFLNRTIVIYNPVTTEFMRLPWQGGYSSRNGGFGYHPSTKEYKILRTICKYGTSSRCHQIYTLGTTGRWRNIKEPSFDYQVPGVHVNGALYWIIKNRQYDGGNMEREMIIMSFDLADEEFRVLTMLPPPLLNNMKPKPHYKLVESRGCLFLFVDQYSSPDDPHIELWVMKENDNDNDNGYRYHWSNLMEISTHGHDEEDYEFLALTQSGKVLFWHKGVFTCFDPKTERFASIRDVHSSGRYHYDQFDIVHHTNSLVSLIALGAIPKNKNKKKKN